MKILKDLLQLSDGSKSIGLGTVIDGVAKAWASIDHTLNTVHGSFNISSFIDNGTGDGTVSFTNAMSDDAYSLPGSAGRHGNYGSARDACFIAEEYTTTSVGFNITQEDLNHRDLEHISMAVQGDLA